jgi:hypothetical protein
LTATATKPRRSSAKLMRSGRNEASNAGARRMLSALAMARSQGFPRHILLPHPPASSIRGVHGRPAGVRAAASRKRLRPSLAPEGDRHVAVPPGAATNHPLRSSIALNGTRHTRSASRSKASCPPLRSLGHPEGRPPPCQVDRVAGPVAAVAILGRPGGRPPQWKQWEAGDAPAAAEPHVPTGHQTPNRSCRHIT